MDGRMDGSVYVCMCVYVCGADSGGLDRWLDENCFRCVVVVVVIAGFDWLISKNKFIYYYFILQYDFFFFLFNEIIKTILLFQALELTWYKK